MHISEGILSAPILITGGVLTIAGTALGIKKLDYDKIVKAGILSAAFFIASLIHINIGPVSAHLVLNGIVGLMLGWSAFPVILVSLILQALFFQFGGITVIGVNTLNMALPAVLCGFLFNSFINKKNNIIASIASFACGFFAVFLSAIMLAFSLYFSEKNFLNTAIIAVSANFPIMIIEGIITVFCISFLKKTKSNMLKF
jgi:cobalt/nickel transport system permease protein